jgi:outer membrane protein OmpA-like peptidoglycan-associated protein
MASASLLCACAATAPQRPMQLRRVILYQNGIGYFERSGHVGGDTLKLEFARGELDDVLKTLTVIDRLGAGVATVDVPALEDKDRTIGLGVRMSAGRVHDVQVSYAVPTPTWKAAYRVVLDPKETDAKAGGLLQGWAMVNNTSQEDWSNVSLTLATGAPMSFAMDLHTPEYVKRPDASGHLIAPPVTGPIDDEKMGAIDSDHDGILDVDDRCPNEPETYNGTEDNDGCPDRGRVVVTDTAIEILDRIYFTKNGDVMMPQSGPICDAIAAALRGNPDIAKVEIDGHASNDESEAWGLASRRSAPLSRSIRATRRRRAKRIAASSFRFSNGARTNRTSAAIGAQARS